MTYLSVFVTGSSALKGSYLHFLAISNVELLSLQDTVRILKNFGGYVLCNAHAYYQKRTTRMRDLVTIKESGFPGRGSGGDH